MALKINNNVIITDTDTLNDELNIEENIIDISKNTIFVENYVKIPLFNNKKEIVDYALVDIDDYNKIKSYSLRIYKKINIKSKYEYKSVDIIINKANRMNLSHFILNKPIVSFYY